ncbi:MAG: YHYH domain-containing protein [Candidatus Lambdaproteobacteria bacterium]|nr:YHYH domain-containing protein [Candidatus Lambdaproteobacteria bacterium]
MHQATRQRFPQRGAAHPSARSADPAPARSARGRGLRLAGLAVLSLALLPAGRALAHPGTLDEYGGHFEAKTGIYHYHRPQPEMSRRKKESLSWIEAGLRGEVRGEVVDVQRPDAVWIEMDYRPAYQELASYLGPGHHDDERRRVQVWLQHVAPELSASRGKEFDAWFRQKVIYELKQKLIGKKVTAQFVLLRSAGRLGAMVLLGDENVNLWMVLNGLSYYLLTGPVNPNEALFIQAEDTAKRNKAGIWVQPR